MMYGTLLESKGGAEVQKVPLSVPAVQAKLSYRVVGQMIDRTNDGRTNDSVEKLLPF